MRFQRTSSKIAEIRQSSTDSNVVEMVLQPYNQMNDRNEIFHQDCFMSVQDNVDRLAAGRMKFTDSHMDGAMCTHGVITELRETPEYLWSSVRMSTTQDSQDLKSKMMQRIIDEASIEFRAVKEEFQPDQSKGMIVRHIHQALLRGASVVTYSSAGVGAVLSVRSSSSNEFEQKLAEILAMPIEQRLSAALDFALTLPKNKKKLRKALRQITGDSPLPWSGTSIEYLVARSGCGLQVDERHIMLMRTLIESIDRPVQEENRNSVVNGFNITKMTAELEAFKSQLV